MIWAKMNKLSSKRSFYVQRLAQYIQPDRIDGCRDMWSELPLILLLPWMKLITGPLDLLVEDPLLQGQALNGQQARSPLTLTIIFEVSCAPSVLKQSS
jgi:hypothetical protein